MLTANIRLMTEEDFHNLAAPVVLPAVFGLDELANNGHFEGAHQIGHEHEGILQNGQRLNGLPLIVVGDVTREFLYALLDLLCRDDLAKWFHCRCVHERAVPPSCNPLIQTKGLVQAKNEFRPRTSKN